MLTIIVCMIAATCLAALVFGFCLGFWFATSYQEHLDTADFSERPAEFLEFPDLRAEFEEGVRLVKIGPQGVTDSSLGEKLVESNQTVQQLKPVVTGKTIWNVELDDFGEIP